MNVDSCSLCLLLCGRGQAGRGPEESGLQWCGGKTEVDIT